MSSLFKSIRLLDVFSFILIIAGIVFSFNTTEFAYRIIGISVSIIGIAIFFYSINTRETIYEERKSPKHKSKENSLDKIDSTVNSNNENITIKHQKSSVNEIKQIDNLENEETQLIKENQKKEVDDIMKEKESKSSPTNIPQSNFSYEDEFSGMRIVGKISGEKLVKKNKYSEKNIVLQESSQKEFESKSADEIKDNIRYKNKKLDIPISVFTEPDHLIGNEPRKEFEYFLSKILLLIRSVTRTRTAFFILLDSSNNRLILESYVTSIPEKVVKAGFFSIGHDAISKIILNQQPEILTKINQEAELDLFPFYQERVGIKCFIGVPVIYDDAVAGVLCAESGKEDVYDAATIAFFGHFTKMISSLIKSFSKSYTLLQKAKIFDVISELNRSINNEIDNSDLYNISAKSLDRVFDFELNGVVGFDKERNSWIIVSSNEESMIAKEINTTNSLIYQSIDSGSTVLKLNDDSQKTYLFDGDNIEWNFFASIPIKTSQGVYGAIFLSSNNINKLSEFDISVLERFAEQLGNHIENIHLKELYRSKAIEDPSTGALNSNAFVKKLKEETARAKFFSTEMSVCFMKIDEYESLNDNLEDLRELAIKISEIIKRHLREFDSFGRLSLDQFGFILVGHKDSTSKFWAEKLRNEIANTTFKINNSSYNITASFGVAKVEKNDTAEGIAANATKALEIAYNKKNNVNIYE